MVGGSDYDCVDVFVLEELAVVLVLDGSGSGLLDGEVQVVVAEVADGHGLIVAVFKEGIVDLVAPVAETDVAHPDAVVSAEDAGVA